MEDRTATLATHLRLNWQQRSQYFPSVCLALLVSLTFVMIGGFAQVDSQQQQVGSTDQVLSESIKQPEIIDILPAPELRPKVRVNVADWTRRLSEEIRAVSNRTSCLYNIERFFEKKAEYQASNPAKVLENITSQIRILLSQHQAAVSAIVDEAERLAAAHTFSWDMTVNYTDVHRLRNELDSPNQTQLILQQQQLQAGGGDVAGGGGLMSAGDPTGTSSNNQGTGQGVQFTSINGGTPVPGPSEWQAPTKSIIMQVNKNFGDIPVNTSMSAIHLPLPIYPGRHVIMNAIDWTERLDGVFKKNLAQYMHVHHQYYGDHLGFLRTFPAHKWRIPRTDPDLFDARTRPWYVAGASPPKDIVVLIDSSGSMTGLRREIARGVVFEILDTLTSNDYFSVMRFSETVTPVGLPKCNLKKPLLALAMEDQCQKLEQLRTMSPLSMTSSLSVGRSNAQLETHRNECQNYARQTDQKDQYLRDHPNVVLGTNGSYLTDDIYKQTIANITYEIEDAYLLPATSRNIRYLKSNFSMPTAGIANFTHALMSAFELLQAYNRSDMGAKCNQAIFLITDGAIKSHDDIFNRYNYPNSPIRVFTYMIGREVGDTKQTKAMACSNRGYYTHVISLGEVREQVLKYLPVMARPLVLEHHHPISWTHAYGDETYQVLTDWVLELKRRERARIMLNEERTRCPNDDGNYTYVNFDIESTNIAEYDDLPQVDEELKCADICDDNNTTQSLSNELDPLGYNFLACHWSSRRADLLTSVVKPVFNTKQNSSIFERKWNGTAWIEYKHEVRDAQLLGVAAVDLRIADIIKAAPSHLLGPNGYAVLMSHNGFVLHHPDLRALLEDPFDLQSKILKPYFNAVDLTHIEQAIAKTNPVMALRTLAVERKKGKSTITVKRAFDCRKRVHMSEQVFHYGPIEDTPFSFMISLPKDYGSNRLQAKIELKQFNAAFLKPSAYDLWAVHPEYRYCDSSNPKSNTSAATILELIERHPGNDDGSGRSPALNVLYDDLTSVNNIAGTGFGSHQGSHRHQSSSSSASASSSSSGAAATRIVCDKELFPSLLFDAAATYEQADSICGFSSSAECDQPSRFYGLGGGQQQQDDSCARTADLRSELARIYGLEMSFLATRSGLTRVRVFDLSPRIRKLSELFIKRHNRAVDEAWYARTVAWNLRDGARSTKDDTIISVPFNANVRLVAAFRLRMTQRRPATKRFCEQLDDRKLDEDADEIVASSPASSAEVSSNSAALDSAASAASDSAQIQNDEPSQPSSAPDGDQSSANSSNGPNVGGADDEQQAASEAAAETSDSAQNSRINLSEYSSFDFLDLLYNSSVHISATQSVIANKPDCKTGNCSVPVAVSGLLYDYATFARRFLNSTSLSIRSEDSEQSSSAKVDICPGGECPTKCGYRNDTIDCLLVDNNGFIVVGEELPDIGRPLTDYDESLMRSLVEKRVFHLIELTDYQAICARNDQLDLNPAGSSSAAGRGAQISSPGTKLSPPSLLQLQLSGSNLAAQLLSNFASIGAYIWTSIYSLLLVQATYSDVLGQLMQLQRSPVGQVDAQSAFANQSMLALLPNKTYLRPCEKTMELYDTRLLRKGAAPGIDSPEYFVTKCGCRGWYVYDSVPKTNLIMLIVNTTAACRKCDSSSNFVPVPVPSVVELSSGSGGGGQTPTLQQQIQMQQAAALSAALAANKSAEEQVCKMLQQDSQLHAKRLSTCYTFHPQEAEIHICGGAQSSARVSLRLLLLLLPISLLLGRNSLSAGPNSQQVAPKKGGATATHWRAASVLSRSCRLEGNFGFSLLFRRP